MSGLVCGLDVHKRCCDATIVDLFGNMVESRRRISREGVANVHVRYDTQFTRAYHRIASRRGRKVAIVALARRLLGCCYAMLRDRKPFVNRAQVP